MPSPIAHLAAAYALYALSRNREPQPELRSAGPLPGLLLVTGAFSLLPDLDSVAGVLAGDFGRFHNNLTHSFFAGVVVALVFAGGMRWLQGRSFWFWFGISLAAYQLHIIMDWATIGRGVMAWWPLSPDRYQAPLLLFYGLHWSQGWLSVRHLWTLATEVVFAAGVWAALRVARARRVLAW